MITNNELDVLYEEAFKNCSNFHAGIDVYRKLNGKHRDQLRKMYCNHLLYTISQGYTKYNPATFEKDPLIQLYLEAVKLLPESFLYFHLTYHFFNRDYGRCLSTLEKYIGTLYEENQKQIKKSEDFIDEYLFIDLFFEPFKQAFPSFWTTLAKTLRKYPTQKGLPELCEVINEYYNSNTDEDALDLLLNSTQKHPNFVLIKELVGYTYYSMKMWNNAIAYFEATEESGLFFTPQDANFMLAWCYGKLKKYHSEEDYYRKALDTAPNNSVILNNLGYCLYRQKKYTEARKIFETCLEIDNTYVYPANNYVRVLIALGRHKDAKDFVKNSKLKISKDIKNRVSKLDNKNARISKETVATEITLQDEDLSQENAVDLGIKRQQFSNEKLLEDELTARIESGMEVFGLQLKMYKRKGLYGRQFIIPVGRLDLLCEDPKGNLYIIELKKDSGYDDAYKQTAEYLDWFENNEISKGKKVYGIICLNSPTQELVDKVHTDPRMKLFEYQISYREL